MARLTLTEAQVQIITALLQEAPPGTHWESIARVALTRGLEDLRRELTPGPQPSA